MRILGYLFCFSIIFHAGLSDAIAACNNSSLGVSRTMQVSTQDGLRVGLAQYSKTLPLRDKEVILTFDDGPIGSKTQRILDALAAECVKATFFVVGSMARAYPKQLRAMARAGHTIAAHSNRHPLNMDIMSFQRAKGEVNDGYKAINEVLGSTGSAAPFFRYPGLAHSSRMNNWLAGRNIGIFSADVMGYDWQKTTPNKILRRTMSELNKRGRGIILLHDIQSKTAAMLPALLRQLKKGGYRIVHMVPKSSSLRLATGVSRNRDGITIKR